MYVDAAYALCTDSNSYMGLMLYMGEVLVFMSSKKHKCMINSPTEAELTALTDNLGI
jgi:hypothetical protein